VKKFTSKRRWLRKQKICQMLLDNALNRQKKIERADELYRMSSSSIRAAFKALKDLNPNTRRRHRDTLEAFRCIKAAKILA